MKLSQFLFISIGTILLLFVSAIGHAQDQHTIDSLKYELVKFEAHKKELGKSASKMLDTTKVNILHKIITVSFKENPLDALDFANQQLLLSEKIQYQWGISQAYNTLGAINDYKGNYQKSLEFYEKSLSVKKKMKDDYGAVDTHINMGVLYSKQFDYSKALYHLYEALEISKRIKDNFGIFGAYNNIGVLYKSQKKYYEALRNYLNCLKLQVSLKDDYFISITYQNIGEVYWSLNEVEKALSYFEKGIKAAVKSKNKQSEANNYDGLGKILQSKKEYKRAYQNFEVALKLRQTIQDSLGIGYSYMHLADVFYEEGNSEKALLNSNKSIELLQQFGELSSIAHGYELLSKIYDKKGNYRLAYQNHVLYKELNDSIFNLEGDKKLTEMQFKYNTKSIRDSLQSIQDKKDIIRREEARIQKATTNYIYLGLSLTLVFMIILLVQRNKYAIIKRQKALEEERNRISRNLHDDLGAQLSAVRMFVSSIKNQENKDMIQETVKNSLDLLDTSIHELRNIMHDIHSTVLKDQGYLAATEVLVNKINQLHVIKFTLSHHNIDKRFDPEIEHELYRVTQELVNNTLKYAQADNVFIEVLKRDGNLIFMYEDDGKGYDYNAVKKGNGLKNIESRIKSVAGSVTFDTLPGAGARTIIEIPL